MVLAEGPCSPLSGVVIRLGGFHSLLSSMDSTGTIVVVYLLSERALATLLPKSSTVNESLWKGIKQIACLRDNKARLYDIEHSSVLNGTGVRSTIYGEVCSSDRTVGSVLQAYIHQQTFVIEQHGD